MPIAPAVRCFYGAEWQKRTRPRILQRAQDACECCGKPNRKTVLIRDGGQWFDGWDWMRWRAPGSELVDLRAPRERGVLLETELGGSMAHVKVVLTIAHINQISGDDRDENLAALCQYCHLWHDRMQHARNARRTRCARKDAARPLLAGVNDNAAIA